jgi:cell division protein ZapA
MEPGAERKTVRVTIFNQTYSLVETDQPGEVESLAQTVDELLTDIAHRAGKADVNRLAVMGCLHLADRLRSIERELNQLKTRVDQKAHQFSTLLDKAIE